MKAKLLIAGALAAASFGTVQATEITANIGVSSAYVFRGAVFGDDAAVSGGVDVSHGMFYAGTWLSSQGGAGSGEEVDVYGGVVFPLGNVSLDLGYIYYAFPGGVGETDASGVGNVSEIYLGTSFDLQTAGGLDTYIWFAPSGADGDFDGDNLYADEYVYFDIGYTLGLTENTSFYAHYGYTQGLGDNNDDDAATELSISDYAIGFTVDDFFIQASYLDDYSTTNDIEPQYIVGWSKEFAVK